MIDLKTYDKAIKVNSQDELDYCYKLFREAGAIVGGDDTIYKHFEPILDYSGSSHFLRIDVGFSGWGNTRGKEVISFKDFKEQYEKEMGMYKDGDILVDEYGDFKKVLKDFGDGIYIMSEHADSPSCNELKRAGEIWTDFELEEDGYKLYNPEEDVLELTVEEVSNMYGKTVKIVEK